MNAHLVGVGMAIISGIIWWRIERIYKRISRRCPYCGRLDVKRIHFIILPEEEKITRRFSLISPTSGKFRWFIRRGRTCTFAWCQNCQGLPSRIWVVKTNTDPISLWHLWWTKLWHPEQYERPRMEYIIAMSKYSQELNRFSSGELHKNSTDTPDLLKGFFRVVQDRVQVILRKFKKK